MTPVVHIVDDDASILRSLARLLAAAGHRCETHASAEAFLSRHDPDVPGCAILDLRLPELDGFGVQQSLSESRRAVVLLNGTGDMPASVRAMKAGAVDFLAKPVAADELLRAVEAALAADATARALRKGRDGIARRLASLTPREADVQEGVVRGLLNKQIAHEPGTAEKTVKIHRARMMAMMGVRSVAELLRLAGVVEQ